MKNNESIINTRYGKMHTFGNNDLISKSLLLYGEWAENELCALTRFISDGDCVLDIGANLGAFTLAFSEIVGDDGVVISFEPHPKIFKKLKKNSFKRSNVKLHPYGLSVNEGKYLMKEVEGNYGASKFDFKSISKYGFQVRPLDSIKITKVISFIKVDVEGNEIFALRGGETTIKRSKPVIFCEVNSLEDGANLLNYLKSIGYILFGHIALAFNEKNFLGAKDNIFGTAAETGIIAIHREKLLFFNKIIEELHLRRLNTLDGLAVLLLKKPQYHHWITCDQIEALEQNLSQHDDQIEALEQNLSQHDDQIEALLIPHSWKITKPLRIIGSKIKSMVSHLTCLHEYKKRILKKSIKIPPK